ncbi:hypothetical protein A3C96_02490 [Candidatus Uhrbacteria bacterium RIFCSPHIGHO2_02_FULL_60_10]|uniref:EF-hand domain-containing protein n=1 Tax=Candidatus Uhrbacteria bacterium RIFCSPHIGHO2_02_FULL_60_10 TaxID=1802392 RepID=A0A1F7U855_9BACT|nr:MAG: hypothetical protein A3C96_02490 [Candidatus Uhrbacteria bacterium RIFCSPHIGHO2_02_FULL_60_10]
MFKLPEFFHYRFKESRLKSWHRLLLPAAIATLVTVFAVAGFLFLRKPKITLAPPGMVKSGAGNLTVKQAQILAADRRYQPVINDQVRLVGIEKIRSALILYESIHGQFPMTLAALVPQYLPAMPTDPVTGETFAYRQTPQDFELRFTFEGSYLSLTPGEHLLSREGYDRNLLPGPPAITPFQPSPNSTQISRADADRDGLTDEEEKKIGTDPKRGDTDGDGLSDGDEKLVFRTNPLAKDTDGDGFIDGEEALAGFDPTKTATRLPDTDQDGLADSLENVRGLDPLAADIDQDGLADGDELRVYGTDPKKPDTDGDGFADGRELRDGFNPLGRGNQTDAARQNIERLTAQYGLHQPTLERLRKQ